MSTLDLARVQRRPDGDELSDRSWARNTSVTDTVDFTRAMPDGNVSHVCDHGRSDLVGLDPA